MPLGPHLGREMQEDSRGLVVVQVSNEDHEIMEQFCCFSYFLLYLRVEYRENSCF